jgi:hypothetical protein
VLVLGVRTKNWAIIDVYVRYNNRPALDALKLHRQKLLIDIKARPSDYDWSLITSEIEEEVAPISAGLDRLPPYMADVLAQHPASGSPSTSCPKVTPSGSLS